MKDFIPDAPFDRKDEPVIDRRWFYQQLCYQFGSPFSGEAPDRYSPHTRTEEAEIQEAIITGVLKPRTAAEKIHRDQIDFPRPRSEWPRKWITCARCGCDWNEIGYPVGRRNRFIELVNAYMLQDSDTKIVWMYPKYCGPCVDYLTAEPKRKENHKTQNKKVRSTQADP